MAKGNRRRSGALLAADDLSPGLLVAIHHWRDGRESGLGISHRIKVVNLPYVVAQPMHHAKHGPVTFDVRRVRFMKVSEEFARAQENGTDTPPPAAGEEEIPF